jgi:hypothetical protein
MRRFLVPGVSAVLCLLVVLSGTAWSETEEGAKGTRNIALLRMELPRGFYSDERVALANQLLGALHRTGRFEIVDREDMEAILDELKFQATDLVDEEEVVRLGELVGVDLFVTCSVKALEGIYQITARLISVETGRVEKIALRRCAAKIDFLSALFNEVAFELAEEEEKKGWLVIETDPPKAEVSLFGIPLGLSPFTLRLAPGIYLLSVERQGYVARRKTLYVESGQGTSWKVKLIKKKRVRLGDYIRGGGFWGGY